MGIPGSADLRKEWGIWYTWRDCTSSREGVGKEISRALHDLMLEGMNLGDRLYPELDGHFLKPYRPETAYAAFDDLMKKNFNGRYMNWKENLAIERAEKALMNNEPR